MEQCTRVELRRSGKANSETILHEALAPSSEMQYHFRSNPLYNTASPVGRTRGSKNQGVEAKEALLPIPPSDPLRESLLSIPQLWVLWV